MAVNFASGIAAAAASNGSSPTGAATTILVAGGVIVIVIVVAILRALWGIACVVTNHHSANVGPIRHAARREQASPSTTVDVGWPMYWPTQTRADIAAVINREGGAWHAQMRPLRRMIGRIPWVFRWIFIIVDISLEAASLVVYVLFAIAYTAIALIVGIVVGMVSLAARIAARWWEKAVIWRRSAEAACHVADCYAVSPRAVYVCPTCDARHRDIRPDRHGGLWRRCRCNTLLPTTTLRAARAHEARCQRCDTVLASRSGTIRSVRLATLGGPSAGKSAWMFAGIGTHRAETARHRHAEVVGRGDDFKAGFRAVQARNAPAADHSGLPAGFTVQVGKGGRAVLAHIFDASGAQLADQAARDELAYFYEAHGLLFAVDPLSIPAVSERLGAGALPTHASPEHPEVAYQQVVNRIRDGGVDLAKLQLAVVVTKCDLLRDAGIEVAADTDGVKEWLRFAGLGNLVNGAEMSFGSTGWFSAVSLGPVPVTSPYNAGHAFDWLLQAHGVKSVLGRRA